MAVRTGSQAVSGVEPFVVYSSPQPQLLSVNPSSAYPGQRLTAAVFAANTAFVAGSTGASFGAGVTTASLTVLSPLSFAAELSVDPLAVPGPRALTVTTGNQTLTLNGAFNILPPPFGLQSVSPSAGQRGDSLSVAIVGYGTSFSQGLATVSFDSGVAVEDVSVSSATSLVADISIAPDAVIGPRTVLVATGSEVAGADGAFSVTAGNPILTSVTPAGGRQGQTLSVAITGQFTGWLQDFRRATISSP